MQQLLFHPAWEKQLSTQDRAAIEALFDATHKDATSLVTSPVFRAAFNYKQELLVTVLIHNFSHHHMRFDKRSVYVYGAQFEGEHLFTLPDLLIPPVTSMPWTFIFPTISGDVTNLQALTVEIEE